MENFDLILQVGNLLDMTYRSREKREREREREREPPQHETGTQRPTYGSGRKPIPLEWQALVFTVRVAESNNEWNALLKIN